jgi:hypothetical protein
VQDPDFPGPFLVRPRRQLRRETVESEEQFRAKLIELRRDQQMVGVPEASKTIAAIGRRQTPITRDRTAVTLLWNCARFVGVAIEIDDETRDRGENRRAAKPLRNRPRERIDTDVDRNMIVEKVRRNSKIDIGGNAVRSMVGHQQQSAVG